MNESRHYMINVMNVVSIRHRLLEGVLLRLAKLPDAGGVVVRGGILLRHWFSPIPRIALDLDLMAHSPLGLNDAARFLPLFSEVVEDGVTFDTERITVEGIWLQSDFPGIRMLVRGGYAGREDDIQIDITGGPSPTPAAEMTEFPTGTGTIRLWTCRAESIVGQKIQALWHLGMHGWRPKDLDDLRILLDRVPMDDDAMIKSISAAFAELGGTGRDARSVFAPESWWKMKHASARWGDYVADADRDGIRNLSVVVANLAARLNPILEDLP